MVYLKRVVTSALLLWTLAACTLTAPGNGFLSGGDRSETPKALTRATLGGGDVILRGPDGWCIEPSSLRSRTSDNFASLAGCHALTQGASGTPVPYGILTVAVSAPRAPGDVDVQQALRQAVSDQPLISTSIEDGVALVHLAPERSATAEGLGDPHWRGVFVQGRRVVMLAAYGPENGAISGKDGGRLLLDLAGSIRASSPDLPEAKPAEPGFELGAGLKRLFN
ncbi:hypothetical protein PGB28_04955 [Primorskyibacter aestuariivivens]|uniref:hypothetical protein n=1 Tax=Primorskyibacter aestuariivivens TaxID=1888912 RepID=UPI00230137BA|nr:hypothetical protein [Primorskyibacter aestuariivivens]MDA7427799.1 hypothetical protein [Primorskyibacter aestuariivivens]